MELIVLDIAYNKATDATRMDKLLRNFPYSQKVTNSNKSLNYSNVVIGIDESVSNNITMLNSIITNNNFNITFNNNINNNKLNMIVNTLFNGCGDRETTKFIESEINNNISEMNVIVKDVLTTDEIKLFHSDGSVNNKTKVCGYGVCELTKVNEELNENFDHLTWKTWEYETHIGSVENGTNNIGELSGIQKAVELSADDTTGKKYYIIVSDSTYGIKCFREWIYNWKKNDYRSANKKPIKNQELIKDIQSKIENTNNVILFGWTKAHVKTFFNEECDKLAKQSVGL